MKNSSKTAPTLPQSETWYCAESYNTLHASITEVQVERSTESSVWIDGQRHHRQSDWRWYWPARELAVGCIRRALDRRRAEFQTTADKYEAASKKEY